MVTKNEMLARSLSNQLWAAIRSRMGAVERIAENGPNDDTDDRELVRRVFYAVLGELNMRNAEATVSE